MFWSAFGLWFTFSPVLVRHRNADSLQGSSTPLELETFEEQEWHSFGPDGFIFVAHRRPGSINWIVPDSDTDLLAGVGALGTSTPKNDDSFESLLMMQMLS